MIDGPIFRRQRGKLKARTDKWDPDRPFVEFRPRIQMLPREAELLRQYFIEARNARYDPDGWQYDDGDPSNYLGSDDMLRDDIAELAYEPIREIIRRISAGKAPGIAAVEKAEAMMRTFPNGTKVMHAKLGLGVVISADFAGGEPCLTVSFDTGRYDLSASTCRRLEAAKECQQS